MKVRLRVVRVKGRKRLVAYVTNAKVKRLRLELRRGKKLVGRRTVKVKKGRAKASFKPRGKGRYRLTARANSRKRTVLGRSGRVRLT